MKATAVFIATLVSLTAYAGIEQTAPAKRGFTLADLKAQIPQDGHGAFLMELSDILNAATDPAVRALLQGQPVVTTAQIAIDPKSKPAPGRVTLVRSQILCCAEHLRKCVVAAEVPRNDGTFNDPAWVRVTGDLSFRQEGDKFTPFIKAREIVRIPTPADGLLR